MGVVLKFGLTDRYFPDIADNRERAKKGDPDVLVCHLKEPTVAIWRRYQGMLIRRRMQEAIAKGIEYDQTEIPVSDDSAEGDLFCSCVAKIEGLILEDGTAITTGAELWAQRDRLSRSGASELFSDVLAAILMRSRLAEGVAQVLAPGSGSPPSADQTDGIAATVAVEG